MVEDGQNGLLVTPGDVQALANGILQLIENANLRQQVIANAYEWATGQTIEAVSSEMAGWIRDAVDQSSSRS